MIVQVVDGTRKTWQYALVGKYLGVLWRGLDHGVCRNLRLWSAFKCTSFELTRCNKSGTWKNKFRTFQYRIMNRIGYKCLRFFNLDYKFGMQERLQVPLTSTKMQTIFKQYICIFPIPFTKLLSRLIPYPPLSRLLFDLNHTNVWFQLFDYIHRVSSHYSIARRHQRTQHASIWNPDYRQALVQAASEGQCGEPQPVPPHCNLRRGPHTNHTNVVFLQVLCKCSGWIFACMRLKLYQSIWLNFIISFYPECTYG